MTAFTGGIGRSPTEFAATCDGGHKIAERILVSALYTETGRGRDRP